MSYSTLENTYNSNYQLLDTPFAASTTTYDINHDHTGAMACGGVTAENALSSVKEYNDTNPTEQYFVVAAATSMGQPLNCRKSGGGGCLSGTAGYDHVAPTHCGSCFDVIIDEGSGSGGSLRKFGAIALDLCPNETNPICPKDGNKNKDHFYNHFDVLGQDHSDVIKKIGINPTVTFLPVECPPNLISQFTEQDMCHSPEWWSGHSQGCPGMQAIFNCKDQCS